jgi:hypothetical protein
MKSLMSLFVLFLVALTVSAQPDFSGKWKLNKEKSTLNDQFSMAPTEISIVQSNNEINMEKKANFQDNEFIIKDKLTLDGKECINDGMMDTKKKSTVTFSDDKKLMIVSSKIPMQDGAEMEIKETYQFTDGLLIIESIASSSWGEMKEKMAYTKQ